MKKLFDPSMWKFLLVGVANTLLSALIMFLLVGVANTLLSALIMFLLEGLGYWPSTAIAYVAGSVLSFFLNRRFTFQSDAPFWPSVLRFAVNVAVCYLVAYSLAQPLAELVLGWLGLPAVWVERLAKLGGMVLFTGLNYFGQRFFAFRKK